MKHINQLLNEKRDIIAKSRKIMISLNNRNFLICMLFEFGIHTVPVMTILTAYETIIRYGNGTS